ncbi:hypothetical protein P7K49_030606 [Saguinus oedipus]|uniref:Uncharacterized protein n=1 Tax=Saguinus oedipus TaxID=9490 RepID=A0ABQ9U2M4_SAGOE|nr:hypothetical protein P7K49_030606 [Saguinus oedipus]
MVDVKEAGNPNTNTPEEPWHPRTSAEEPGPSYPQIGIQNYSTTSSCQARASQVRSDYGTLFVVLVVIGAICIIIIALGLLYNCWQRRLPKLKHVSHGEELRFVENGCHDNPTLDVASDSQSEMPEKHPSLNGGGALNGPGSWGALMGGKRDPEDSDVFEEDTHLRRPSGPPGPSRADPETVGPEPALPPRRGLLPASHDFTRRPGSGSLTPAQGAGLRARLGPAFPPLNPGLRGRRTALPAPRDFIKSARRPH